MTMPAPPVTPEQILQRLDWRVIRRLDGLLQGDYRTAFYGAGVDFADLREYEPGDDIRHIDWNVTARMDTPYIRQYVADRELTAWLLLDRSQSMGFGPIGSTEGTRAHRVRRHDCAPLRPVAAIASAPSSTTTRSSASSNRAAAATRCCGSRGI